MAELIFKYACGNAGFSIQQMRCSQLLLELCYNSLHLQYLAFVTLLNGHPGSKSEKRLRRPIQFIFSPIKFQTVPSRSTRL